MSNAATVEALVAEIQKLQAKEEKKVFKNVNVMFVDDPNAKTITLPQGMSYADARVWLKKMEDEENRTFIFEHHFKGWYPLDAMYAVYRAMAEIYGFAHVGDFPGFWKDTPPTSVTVEIAYGQMQQIPWGPIQVHDLSGMVFPQLSFYKGLPSLTIKAEVKNKERPILDQLVAKAVEVLQRSSIYRGKAIEVDFTIFNPRSIEFDPLRAPKFMDTQVKEEDIILSRDVQDLVSTNLFTPIRHAAACRAHKIPLRRGLLLNGKYGVGKTLLARITAMLCEKNGWTFVYLRDLNQLSQALAFAKQYEPCVVFAEDVNRVVSGDRDANMDAIFNVLDGVDRKNDEVMVVFTTNNIEQIHEGMLRPGRIDTVVEVTPPDATAAERLIRFYGRGLVEEEADLAKVGKLLEGNIPAIIREAVERSKLAAIHDHATRGETGPLVVSARHLELAALQMLDHAKLLAPPPAKKPDVVLFGETLGRIIVAGAEEHRNYTNDWNDKALNLLSTQVLEGAGRPDEEPTQGN